MAAENSFPVPQPIGSFFLPPDRNRPLTNACQPKRKTLRPRRQNLASFLPAVFQGKSIRSVSHISIKHSDERKKPGDLKYQ